VTSVRSTSACENVISTDSFGASPLPVRITVSPRRDRGFASALREFDWIDPQLAPHARWRILCAIGGGREQAEHA
jgi:hypothetical protein